jgi:serine/threonine-protein kinase
MSGAPAGTGQLIGQRLGKYEVLALLALGGTAEIYLARIEGTAGFEKYVVIKCLHDHLADDQEFVRMFLDEARLAAQLDHSNIVQTFELGQHHQRYYMAMEFLAGLSLAMIVRRVAERVDGGKLPLPLVLNVIAQTCAGLQYAHERTGDGGAALNVVHRDISPQNLVISFEGVVKIVDFGIARAEQRETKTRAGTIKGKFAYMSPEQCVSANIDRRTDVFALGIILHELLTGRRLFKRANQYETYQAVIECNVPPPSAFAPELDATLDAVVMKALSKTKEERYASAEAFGDAVQRVMHQRSMFAGPAEIARFFESVFAQEADEHAARMRELIAGREFASGGSTGVNWDEELSAEEVEESQSEHVLSTSDVSIIDDEPPPQEEGAERTRIEMNPLERVLALEAERKDQAAGVPTAAAKPLALGNNGARASRDSTSQPVPLPAPPTGPVRSSFDDVDPMARTIERPRPPEIERAIREREEREGKANRKTAPANVVLERTAPEARPLRATPPAGVPASFPEAKTVLGENLDPPTTPVPPRRPTAPELKATAIGGPTVMPGSGELLLPSSEVVLVQDGLSTVDIRGPVGNSPSGPRESVPPPMSPGFSPMGPGGSVPPPMGPMGPGGPMMGPGGPMMGPGGPMMGPGGPMMGPGGPGMMPPMSGPMGPGGYPMAPGLPLPAHLMSPAPGGYHGGVDLGQMANRPIRRVPPWALAVLFVIALGGALLITIMFAKACR